MIKENIKGSTKKVMLIDACYSYSAMDIFKKKEIPNIAVITSIDKNGTLSSNGPMLGAMNSPYIIRKDFDGDGSMSLKDVILSLIRNSA